MKDKMKNALPIGTILQSGKQAYRIEQVLGVGGFGITYKVSATVKYGNVPIFTYFAIKEFFLDEACERGGTSGQELVYSRPLKDKVETGLHDFYGEARRLEQLCGKNPNIVPVNEVFEANGTVYYVMEFLNGGSLRNYVHTNGPMSDRDALNVLEPIMKAVDYLHSNLIMHLDVKPDNVMFKITPDGRRIPVLIDFGLALHFSKEGRPTTSIRQLACSEGYAPVEQYAGIQMFAPPADIYALTATLLFMLTGKDPIISTDMTPNYIANALPASSKLKDAIVFGMANQKFDRPQTVGALITALEHSLTANPENKTKVIDPAKKPVVKPASGVDGDVVITGPLHNPQPNRAGGNANGTERPTVLRRDAQPKKDANKTVVRKSEPVKPAKKKRSLWIGVISTVVVAAAIVLVVSVGATGLSALFGVGSENVKYQSGLDDNEFEYVDHLGELMEQMNSEDAASLEPVADSVAVYDESLDNSSSSSEEAWF